MDVPTRKITVEGLWREYRDACYPPAKMKLDALQESETRQAFYAGCLTAAKILVDSSQHMDEATALRNIKLFIDEATAVCKERTYELRGQN